MRGALAIGEVRDVVRLLVGALQLATTAACCII